MSAVGRRRRRRQSITRETIFLLVLRTLTSGSYQRKVLLECIDQRSVVYFYDTQPLHSINLYLTYPHGRWSFIPECRPVCWAKEGVCRFPFRHDDQEYNSCHLHDHQHVCGIVYNASAPYLRPCLMEEELSTCKTENTSCGGERV
ncbi:hypothetical protein Hamer_G018613 [Homarus americanus]|uniref:Uncharacterized protein n=1 Tax=Homarus americanus TaxID=6706 RepID=A0A8J5N1H5_HOMAM|nr:hypothetical protein Hamer_G018613 [Homarus americanus]